MISNRKSSYVFKGDGYCFSHLQTIDREERYPWVCSYFSDKVREISLIKRARYLYHKESDFFTLIAWTIVILFSLILVALSEFIVITNYLWFLLPIFISFFGYLWTGLLLKYYMLTFSLGICLIGCLVLEVLVELLTLNGFILGITRFFGSVSLILSFIIMLTGMFIINTNKDIYNHATTWTLLSTVVIVRLIIMDDFKMFQMQMTLPPLLAYICILGGLSVSSLTNLKIPHFNVEDMDFRNPVCDMESIPVIRQRRASSVEVPVLHQNGVNTASVKTRRKSLPVLGYSPARKFSMSSVDLSILGEAHGMITDLLADSSLPVNVTGTLRIVADMISPLLQNSFNKQPFSTALLTVLEKSQYQVQEDEQQVMNQPDFKDDTPLSLKQRLQRNLGVSSRRMSSSYTTTTSATGMPTIDMEYHSKRNLLPLLGSKNELTKRVANRSKSCAGILAERKLFAASKSLSFSQSPNNKKDSNIYNEDGIFKIEINKDKPIYFDGMDTSADDEDSEKSVDKTNEDVSNCNSCDVNVNLGKPVGSPEVSKRTSLSSVCEKSETNKNHKCMFSNDQSTDTSTLKLATYEDSYTSIENEKLSEPDTENDTSCTNSLEDTSDKKEYNSSMQSSNCNQNTSNTSISRLNKNQVNDLGNLPVPVTYNKRKSSRELHMEYEKAVSQDVDDLLCRIGEWDFPIFELSEKCNILTQLAFRIFTQCDFFKKFKIPETTFLKYFRALESGYHEIPYHNRIHAADVLHGVYYLTQHRIPGFNENFCSRRSSIGNIEIPEEECSLEEDYTYGCMVDLLPDLELMGLYTAAAMHDFDHPGRTNAFLVATLNPKALLYNDRSVLESHHAAASWSLLVTNPGLNFLAEMDPVDFKRFRFIVIEEILSTDLKKHFDFLTEWNAKVSEQGGGLNFSCESDRLLVGQMAIKLADISGPTKEWSLHYRWTDRLIEEFYQQGEDERSLGIPLSAYMDRVNPKVPQLQASFINHLVSPLYAAYEKANTMPGEWVDCDSDDEEEVEAEHSPNTSDGESSEAEKPVAPRKKKIIYSCISDNINKNYKKWLDIIEETEKNNPDKQSENGDDESLEKIVENEVSLEDHAPEERTKMV